MRFLLVLLMVSSAFASRFEEIVIEGSVDDGNSTATALGVDTGTRYGLSVQVHEWRGKQSPVVQCRVLRAHR